MVPRTPSLTSDMNLNVLLHSVAILDLLCCTCLWIPWYRTTPCFVSKLHVNVFEQSRELVAFYFSGFRHTHHKKLPFPPWFILVPLVNANSPGSLASRPVISRLAVMPEDSCGLDLYANARHGRWRSQSVCSPHK